jgi:hypothetical protein
MIITCEDQTFLGKLAGVDMNSTADQAISIRLVGATNYIIEKILVTNASASLSLAAGGIYTAASKGGTAIVAAGQVYSALTGSTKVVSLTLAVLTDVLSASTVYLSLTVAQGTAATADIYVFGRLLP